MAPCGGLVMLVRQRGAVGRRDDRDREPRDGGGQAVRFPPPCAVYGDRSCARAVLESGPADLLNPEARPLRFGASIRLAPTETAKGENVLQKGYSAKGSQYKLQIDGSLGRPSCVLVGAGVITIALAR